MRIVSLFPFIFILLLRKRPRSMDSPGQFAIDIKEFAGRIVALEALGKPAKSPVPRVTGPEICALVSRAPMYRERLGGIKGMRPAGSPGPISLFQGSTFLDVPCDLVARTYSPRRTTWRLVDRTSDYRLDLMICIASWTRWIDEIRFNL